MLSADLHWVILGITLGSRPVILSDCPREGIFASLEALVPLVSLFPGSFPTELFRANVILVCRFSCQ